MSCLQVEVKDATVKTFAEIMAEKKRKRLLAQQEKPYTPISFDDKGRNIIIFLKYNMEKPYIVISFDVL
jgi:hypothetical protein